MEPKKRPNEAKNPRQNGAKKNGQMEPQKNGQMAPKKIHSISHFSLKFGTKKNTPDPLPNFDWGTD